MGSRFFYDTDDEIALFKDVKEGENLYFRAGYRVFGDDGALRLKNKLPSDDWTFNLNGALAGFSSAAVAYAVFTMTF